MESLKNLPFVTKRVILSIKAFCFLKWYSKTNAFIFNNQNLYGVLSSSVPPSVLEALKEQKNTAQLSIEFGVLVH
jgi:hypothetical protein